jgi:hypothetical protein
MGLSFSLYIVGGLLTSTFIQQNLPKEHTSFLGFLVLASKLIHDKFRPDLALLVAKSRVLQLRRTILNADDELLSMELDSSLTQDLLIEFRQKLADVLVDMEYSELQDASLQKTSENESAGNSSNATTQAVNKNRGSNLQKSLLNDPHLILCANSQEQNEYIKAEFKDSKIRKVTMLQYSGRACRDLILHLLTFGTDIELYLQSDSTARKLGLNKQLSHLENVANETLNWTKSAKKRQPDDLYLQSSSLNVRNIN